MANTAAKIMNREEVVRFGAEAKARGLKVGFTSGSFDLIHPGHISYLEEAKRHCDVLIVGINSDSSVRRYKNSLRPLIPQADRARVVAGLSAVDAVFIFDELNNNQNILHLKPDLYIKAGDYEGMALSSAPLVESYGGKTILVPYKKGYSSSSIIERAAEMGRALEAGYNEIKPLRKGPAVFLDRDGTLIEHVEFLHEPEKLRVLPGVPAALCRLRQAGFRLVIITNQPGIGLGYYTKEDFYRVNRELLRALSKAGVLIDKVYFCPHSKAHECTCRKPETDLVKRAEAELNLDLPGSFVVGDMTIDIMLAKNSGCRGVLVKTGYAGKDGYYDAQPDFIAADLTAAADWVLSQTNQKQDSEYDQGTLPPETPQAGACLEAIGKVAGKLGHDFNNLLGAMRGCLDVMKNKISTSQEPGLCVRQLQIMEKSLHKALLITGKMRGFVRPGPLHKTTFRLSACIQSVLGLLRESVELPFEIHFESKADPAIEASEYQVMQMLMSLCLNAIDAMQRLEERILLITLEEQNLTAAMEKLLPGHYAHLVIVDHGSGMDEQVKAHLFQPFLSTKTGEIGKGLGLSLAMAKEIMHRHQGEIQIRSIPGCGTAAHLYFPRATET